MSQTASRIRRLLIDELGECCTEDVENRLATLERVADAAFEEDAARPLFEVLGNETRYRLARALVAADDELCVCELETFVTVSESAVSHALSDLVNAGVAERRKQGNWRYYRATDVAESVLAAADQGMVDSGRE